MTRVESVNISSISDNIMPSQILLFDQSRSASTSTPENPATIELIYREGHLLARMLSKQSRLELLSNPYSGCRGKQVEWLISDDWEQGMSDAAYSEFQASARKATALWQEALVQSQRRVSAGRRMICYDQIL